MKRTSSRLAFSVAAALVARYAWRFVTLQLKGKYSFPLTNKKTSMKKILFSGWLVFLIFNLLPACSPGLKVNSDYDRTADFTAYKTFSFLAQQTTGQVNELNQARIEKSIKAALISKGYVETANHPDLLVNAFTVLKDKRGVTATTSYYGFGGVYRPYGFWATPVAGSTSISTYDYKDGSLLIDIVDAKTKKMVWTGSGSAEVYKRPKNPEQVITEVVGKILNSVPAAK